jgi:hypothetical protein
MVVEQLLSTNGIQSQLFDPVPEPASWMVVLFGLIGLGFICFDRRKNQSSR